MLRGRLTSTVRPVSASMLATVMLSGRSPGRPLSASPPISKTLNRPCLASVSPPPAKTVATKSRWVDTIEAEAISPPTTVRTRARFEGGESEPMPARQFRRPGQPERVDEQGAPAERDDDQQHLDDPQHGVVGEQRNGRAAPDQGEHGAEQDRRPQSGPDAQRDPADPLVARRQLGRPGQNQRHAQVTQGPTELDSLTSRDGVGHNKAFRAGRSEPEFFASMAAIGGPACRATPRPQAFLAVPRISGFYACRKEVRTRCASTLACHGVQPR